jgi:hypothetical protein
MKFEIGKTYRIKTWEELGKKYGIDDNTIICGSEVFLEEMKIYSNHKFVANDGDKYSDDKFDNYTFTPEMCELVEINDYIPAVKPPLGIMPRNIYEEQRIHELANAISRQFEDNYPPNYELILEWNLEITDRILGLKKNKE